MNLQTVPTVCKALGVTEARVRRAIADRKLKAMKVGNRTLVDLDEAREALRPDEDGAGIADVAAATGLTVTAIRRGIREGWIPCRKPGKAYVFDLDAVRQALARRMDE